MPIEFIESSEGLKVSQSFDSPSVYLDHWAIRMFSDDQALQHRLVAALKRKQGTLLLSNFSLAEMGGASDPQHIFDTESFLERCLPRIFLTNCQLDEVRFREEGEGDNMVRFWPTADLHQLKLFGERSHGAGTHFSLKGIGQMGYEYRESINELMHSNAQAVIDAVIAARADPDYVHKARHTPLDDRRPRSLIIMGELIRGVILDSHSGMSKNDATDLVHASMPLNCCDYVLLDAAWAERVKKMNARLAKSKLAKMPIAKCFSQRDGGIEAFLADFERFDPHVQPAPARP
jgi:hypothetical protein